ncbi:hypothetical protein J5N97_025766 [Dioscorea zingiberensis]|uniref:Tetratricopeptide repeat protein 1 n=1 Tax=Dioscorea zingiberensis TaxID=325984 RepID=A0A9D5C1V1_9LILI|nr:hypothetical protein J5N97_025766 [Dioscorea zingiberensis]
MVLIEQEPDDASEASDHAAVSRGEEEKEAESDEESFEDALNEEQLLDKARDQVNDAKTEGNRLFGTGQYEEALSKYELALQIASEVPSSEEVRSMCHANRAICFLKLGKYDETVKECNQALELNPSYVKALLRRAEAHEKLDHLEEAIADMKKIIEVEPSNDQARRRTIQKIRANCC